MCHQSKYLIFKEFYFKNFIKEKNIQKGNEMSTFHFEDHILNIAHLHSSLCPSCVRWNGKLIVNMFTRLSQSNMCHHTNSLTFVCPLQLLDDNRELFIPETQQTVKAHPQFMLFATQNPPGQYGGRKVSIPPCSSHGSLFPFDIHSIIILRMILHERLHDSKISNFPFIDHVRWGSVQTCELLSRP